MTVISCSCTSTSVLMYNTSSTALHINSSDLLDNTAYTYTVRGWNEQLSNNSKPFTLGKDIQFNNYSLHLILIEYFIIQVMMQLLLSVNHHKIIMVQDNGLLLLYF